MIREIEMVDSNFDKLAFPEWHPARSPRDTFYVDADRLLRTETSPSQIHILEEKAAAGVHGLDRPALPP